MSIIIHTNEGHPLVGSPKIKVRTTMKTIINSAINENNTPKIEAICKGLTLNAVIPSIEYLNNS